MSRSAAGIPIARSMRRLRASALFADKIHAESRSRWLSQ
jgi:hypothetical protein